MKSVSELWDDFKWRNIQDQSPQPSSSGYPLQAVMGEESPGPSAPRVDPHPPPPSCGWKRRREESEEETAPGAEDVWVVETLCGLKMKLKRQRLSSVLPEHHEVFNRLLEDPVVKRFLAWDKNLRVSDKYLLSMVVAYFSRAGLFSWQFQRIHFFLALRTAGVVLRMCSSSSVRVRARAVPPRRSRFLSVPRSPLAVLPRLRPQAGKDPRACGAERRPSGPAPSGRRAVRAGRSLERRPPSASPGARGLGRRGRAAAAQSVGIGPGPFAPAAARPRFAGR
ncbi:speedy protein E4-like [Puma concolor]|uniref:Speedy protein E4-like n=1 Tax=Puma concolor TaxID=9696 RepID=A0A6P6HU30_PUMCO|nr:speedy protein E4-like [Puma concolor]